MWMSKMIGWKYSSFWYTCVRHRKMRYNDDRLETIVVNPFFIQGCMNLQVESVFHVLHKYW